MFEERNQLMKILQHTNIFVILFAIIFTFSVKAQENLRNELFNDVDMIMNQARDQKANIYAPSSFEKALKYYGEAADLFKRGKSLEDIREKIKNSAAYFAKALDICKLGEVNFSAAMSARADAERAGAWKFSRKLWDKAEEQLKSSAVELEDHDMESAKEKAGEAEATFRAAELEAIKANYLSPARELLKKAEEMDVEDNAPRTIEIARKLSLQVENILKQNRYDTDEARQLAEEAKYEAAHAIYLHRTIGSMKQDKKSLEEIILAKEFDFKRVASTLGISARFDNGFDPVINEMIAVVKERDSKIVMDADSLKRASQIIKDKDAEIENLKQQIELMIKRLGTLSEAEKKLQDEGVELQKKLDHQHAQQETIRKVASMFTEEEGNVLREGDKTIIRLYGLTFPVGKYTIESQYYPLLTKVQEAIKRLPHSRVMVEGHTDSQGSDDVNQGLSERRANAVAEYLMANMLVEFPINSEGFGESKPIASNDSPEGRAKNRRIDIVITPESGGVK